MSCGLKNVLWIYTAHICMLTWADVFCAPADGLVELPPVAVYLHWCNLPRRLHS